MKPPSTVEARVAEELRNWLSSELEQLDASNTNQFAHHVVTILLHEDLDIEDEPLSTDDDDFLLYISSNRQGKNRDNQKQAAVQFLRKAVCSSESGESEIEGVVDELMVKIEETKIKLSSKLSPKRNVLAPISVNVDNWHGLASVQSSSSSTDQERLYNEAFPSLRSSSKDRTDCYTLLQAGTEDRTACHSLLQAGTESILPKNKQQQQQHETACHLSSSVSREAACSLSSSVSREEAEAWNITWQVVVAALAETPVPFSDSVDSLASDERRDVIIDERRDVIDESRDVIDERRDVIIDERRDVAVDFLFAETCQLWALHSAFQACTLLRRFTPSTAALGASDSQSGASVQGAIRQFCPILISQNKHNILQNLHLEPSFTTSRTKFFRPIKEIRSASPLFEADIEVASIFSCSQTMQQQEVASILRCSQTMQQQQQEVASILGCSQTMQQQEVASILSCSQTMQQQEVASIFSCSQTMQQQEEDSSWPTHTRTQKIVEYVDQNLASVIANKGHLSHDNNLSHDVNNLLHDDNNLSHDINNLSHDVNNLSHDANDLSHDRPCDIEIACDVQDLTLEPSCSMNKFFKPSLLTVCLNEDDSHFLQRALVNTYFSKLYKKTAFQAQVPISSTSYSHLDPYYLSKQFLYREECDDEVDESELVPGSTCSCWLENNCYLGEACPFSHPRLEEEKEEEEDG